MTSKTPRLSDAADMVHLELTNQLGDKFEIAQVIPDSFSHEGQLFHYVTVYLKAGHPDMDPRQLTQIEVQIHNKLSERGFDPVPAIDYADEEQTVL
jgi:hypothetical protein